MVNFTFPQFFQPFFYFPQGNERMLHRLRKPNFLILHSGIKCAEVPSAVFRTIYGGKRVVHNIIPENRRLFHHLGNERLVPFHDTPDIMLPADQTGDIPPGETGYRHIPLALAIIPFGYAAKFSVPVFPFFSHQEGSRLTFQPGILSNQYTVHAGQHPRMLHGTEETMLFHFLPGTDGKFFRYYFFEDCAEMDGLVIRQFFRLEPARLFRPEPV